MTREGQRYQKMQQAGLCRCGEPRGQLTRCERCRLQFNANRTRRSGRRPWVKGKPGRPPREAATDVHEEFDRWLHADREK